MARNTDVVDSFAELVRDKSMDRDIMQSIIEDTLSMIMKKKYGQDANFDIVLNMDKGEIEIFLIKEVVADGDVLNPSTQIELTEANKTSSEKLDVGDEHVEIIDYKQLRSSFDRRLVISARQNLNQRIRDIEKDTAFNEYSGMVGEIVVGEVYQIRRGDVYVLHNRTELRMPRNEQIPRERYKKGDTIRAVIKDVFRSSTGAPEIVISRADPLFMQRLFENEIPEIYDGVIEIKGIAREPGECAKVAVLSNDDRVDAVGACVGMKGVRIHSIVRELCNENIDMIPFNEVPATYVARALSPAKPKEVSINAADKHAVVLLDADQVALAVGRGGQNVRLATKLTGFTIELVKEGGEDIELSEFEEEFGEEMVDALYEAGFKTAKQVLDADDEELLEVEGMTPERLTEIRDIMRKEFDEDEEIPVSDGETISVKKKKSEEEPQDKIKAEEEPQDKIKAEIEEELEEMVVADEKEESEEEEAEKEEKQEEIEHDHKLDDIDEED
ncbi:MAG TPA: transcription termination factor NusA [Candidatus Kapabacteria bacterium]|nr:transcription termination factor NusA [Candidatus Kapabacteria bacterium]